MTRETVTQIAIVTGDQAPTLTADGRAVLQELEERGLDADPAVWDDPQVDWSTFDAILLRSCWQYHTRPGKFQSWLRRVADSGVEVINPVDVVQWNLHKFYLRDLAEAGVSILPTRFVEADGNTELQRVLGRNGWDSAVVKPAIGTSSVGVWKTSREDATEHQPRFEALASETDVLVQEFAPEIADGERSLVFLGGAFSHATRNHPAPDDFRAHPNYGGTTEAYDPPAGIISQAKDVLHHVYERLDVEPADVPYARVDGLERNGDFLLMELELIEPYLSLDTSSGAVRAFVDAVERPLNDHGKRTQTYGDGGSRPRSPDSEEVPDEFRQDGNTTGS